MTFTFHSLILQTSLYLKCKCSLIRDCMRGILTYTLMKLGAGITPALEDTERYFIRVFHIRSKFCQQKNFIKSATRVEGFKNRLNSTLISEAVYRTDEFMANDRENSPYSQIGTNDSLTVDKSMGYSGMNGS